MKASLAFSFPTSCKFPGGTYAESPPLALGAKRSLLLNTGYRLSSSKKPAIWFQIANTTSDIIQFISLISSSHNPFLNVTTLSNQYDKSILKQVISTIPICKYIHLTDFSGKV